MHTIIAENDYFWYNDHSLKVTPKFNVYIFSTKLSLQLTLKNNLHLKTYKVQLVWFVDFVKTLFHTKEFFHLRSHKNKILLPAKRNRKTKHQLYLCNANVIVRTAKSRKGFIIAYFNDNLDCKTLRNIPDLQEFQG